MSIVEKFGLCTFATGVLLILLWNVLAGGISLLPGFIALGGLIYWLVGVVLFQLFKTSVRNRWQRIACATPVILLVCYLIYFYTTAYNYDGVPKKYLIRKGFQGRITIVYDHPKGITPVTRGDTTIFVIPPDGMLLVDIPYEQPDFESSSFYYMGLGDSTRKKIKMHYRFPNDTTNIQMVRSGSGMAGDKKNEYKRRYYDIDIPNEGYRSREEKYSREEYRKLFRLAYGDRAYRERFGNKPD